MGRHFMCDCPGTSTVGLHVETAGTVTGETFKSSATNVEASRASSWVWDRPSGAALNAIILRRGLLQLLLRGK